MKEIFIQKNSHGLLLNSVIVVFFMLAIGGSFSFAYAQTSHSSSSLITEIFVPEDPMKIHLASDGLLYVPSFSGATITIIDTKDSRISQQIQLENNEQAIDVLPIPEQDKIYVPIFGAGKINVYSLENNSLEDVIFLPESTIDHETPPSDEVQEDVTFQTSVWSLDYNPKNRLVYAADYNSHVIHVIDVDTNVIIQTMDVARHPYSVKVDHITDTIIVTSLAGNAISFITNNNGSVADYNESITHQVATVIESKIGPWGMDVDAKNSIAYITNRGADILTVVDIKEQEIVNEIPLESRGQAVTVDSNNNEIYVGYYQQDDIILRIDGTDGNVLSAFDPEAVASGIEFDSENDMIYLSLKDANKIIAATPDDIFEKDTLNYGNNGGSDDGIFEEIEETLEDIGESIEDAATIPDKNEMIQMSGTTLDGTIKVDVYSSKPQETESMSIIVEFFDTDSGQMIKGVTHDLTVTQTDEEINSFSEVFLR